jgi:N6-adenosine-specific RNA methylase IME4
MKYQIIYADPPWKFKYYGKSDDRYRRAENHYSVMNLDDIKNMDIQDISSNDCCLFLWVIDPMLHYGIEVMNSWGFKYKTVAFTWVKKYRNGKPFYGMGFWTRSNPEMCLLGTKGHPKRVSCNVPQLVISPIKEHSRKPDEIRRLIVELCGDVPRIELFARNRFDGWDCYGNQLSTTIQKMIN